MVGLQVGGPVPNPVEEVLSMRPLEIGLAGTKCSSHTGPGFVGTPYPSVGPHPQARESVPSSGAIHAQSESTNPPRRSTRVPTP